MTFRHKPIASVTELSLHYLDYWDLGARLVALGGGSYYLIVGLGSCYVAD
jgi:glucose dehydrogenase